MFDSFLLCNLRIIELFQNHLIENSWYNYYYIKLDPKEEPDAQLNIKREHGSIFKDIIKKINTPVSPLLQTSMNFVSLIP